MMVLALKVDTDNIRLIMVYIGVIRFRALKIPVQVGLPKCSDGILQLDGVYEAHGGVCFCCALSRFRDVSGLRGFRGFRAYSMQGSGVTGFHFQIFGFERWLRATLPCIFLKTPAAQCATLPGEGSGGGGRGGDFVPGDGQWEPERTGRRGRDFKLWRAVQVPRCCSRPRCASRAALSSQGT